jgi:hypothetical protein
MLLSLAALAPLLLAAVDAPITAVTVYSDRARVTRTAQVDLHGTEAVEFPLLLDSVDTSSLRLEGQGADVRRVDIGYVDATAFPSDQARDLLKQLQGVDDQLALASAQRDAYQAQLGALQRLSPRSDSGADPLKPRPKLNPGGWASVLTFSATNQDKLEAKVRDLDKRLFDLGLDRFKLVETARIIGGAQRRSGYKVVATVAGQGSARLTLTYMVGSARWYPTYDVALAPEKGQVRVSFAGLVSQESGEDWSDAALTLSTAVPASALVFPKLLSWKIGEKERFIPTPVAQPEPALPAPPASPYVAANEREDDLLRQRLLAVAGTSGPQEQAVAGKNDRDHDGVADQLQIAQEQRRQAEVNRQRQLMEQAAISQREYEKAVEEDKKEAPKPRPMAPPAAEPPPPPGAPSPVMAEETTAARNEKSSLLGGLLRSRDEAPPQPSSELGIAPPAAYVPPAYAADLPASLAGGYDLAFPSLRKETIKSGGGARRVALFSQVWPVTVERKLFPALAPEAFLVAELKSPSPTALPGGTANLFVGADPAGVARLDLVAPGEKFTLPLGLDRAVRPIRNVKVVEAEKGLIGKEEITEYVVTTEVANPYPVPIAMRILDQWPLTDQKDVEIELKKTEPYAIQDQLKGSLEWRVTVAPRGKTQVSFTYSIRRPKGWRMHQQ